MVLFPAPDMPVNQTVNPLCILMNRIPHQNPGPPYPALKALSIVAIARKSLSRWSLNDLNS